MKGNFSGTGKAPVTGGGVAALSLLRVALELMLIQACKHAAVSGPLCLNNAFCIYNSEQTLHMKCNLKYECSLKHAKCP